MATETAQLVVALEARFDKLEESLRNAGVAAERGVDNIERKFRDANPRMEAAGRSWGESLARGLMTAFTALGVAGLITRQIQQVQQAMTEAERIQKIADESRLRPGTVRALEFGGLAAGVDQSEVGQAIKHFSDLARKSASDAEEAIGKLRRVNAELATMYTRAATQEEQLNVVLRAISRVTGEAQRRDLVETFFGSSTERMQQFLINTRGSVEEIRRQAEAAGMSLNDAMISRAASLGREYNRLSAALNDQMRPAMIALMPLMIQFAQIMTSVGEATQHWFTAIEDRSRPVLERTLETARSQLESLRASRAAMRPAAPGDEYSPSAGTAVEDIDREIRVLENVIERAEATIRRLDRPQVTIRGRFERARNTSSSDDESSTTRDAFTRALEAQDRATAQLGAEAEAVGLTDAARQRLLLTRRLETIAVQRNTRAEEDSTEVSAEQRREIERRAQAHEQAALRLERLRLAQQQNLELQRFLGQEMVSSISGLISGTSKLSDVVSKLAQKFADAALQAALLGEGPLAGLFGTASATPNRNVGGLLGALFSMFTPRASGGPVAGGAPYLVGESGPELFVPGSAGMIMPNAALRGGGGAVELSMWNDFRGADPGTEARINLRLQQLRLELPGIVVKTVQSAQQNRVLG